MIAILAAQDHQEPSRSECNLAMLKDGVSHHLDFRVSITPLVLGEHQLLVMVLQDIGAVTLNSLMKSC